MKMVYRYELLKPSSIAEAEDMWIKSEDGKKCLSAHPSISSGEVQSKAFAWLFERIEMTDDPPQIIMSLEERKVIALEKIASAFVGSTSPEQSVTDCGQPPPKGSV